MSAQPDADLEPWLALSLIPGLGDESLRKLLLAFGSPEKTLAAGFGELSKTVSASLAQRICDGGERAALQPVWDWLADPANSIVTLADTDYPQRLLQIADPPPLLYVKGRRDLLNAPALAVVGSRNATAQGIGNAEDFSQALSDAGLTIISGLALGVDAAAHRGGLRGRAASIAVIGTGLDIVYPARNRDLAHQLAREGTLISEFPLGMPAIGGNFPRRNRIISGMSLGVLVVEAALRSGSLITARQALEQGREVFAIPGSIHSPLSKGCHALIKQGAKLAESAQDIVEELGWRNSATVAPGAQVISPAAETVLEHLGFDPCDLDSLCARSGLTAETLSAMLLQLELEGLVASLPGGLFQRLR
ncbi:MAG: DNA-processing protein DprA [Pseudomonadota bacterium]